METMDPQTGDSQVPRAHRFPISAPILYRERGESEWNEGTTVNISRSGILFRSSRDLQLKSMLEMRILFPAEITGGAEADVICWGPVVRSGEATPPDPRPCFAAAIVHYQIRPASGTV
jgi:hypothetical protein